MESIAGVCAHPSADRPVPHRCLYRTPASSVLFPLRCQFVVHLVAFGVLLHPGHRRGDSHRRVDSKPDHLRALRYWAGDLCQRDSFGLGRSPSRQTDSRSRHLATPCRAAKGRCWWGLPGKVQIPALSQQEHRPTGQGGLLPT